MARCHARSFLALLALVLGVGPAIAQTVPQQRIVPNVRNVGDNTASAVNMDGDAVIIGVPFHDARGSDTGSAFVFRTVGSVWVLQDRLDPEGVQPTPPFGAPVAVSQPFAFVGARGQDASGGLVIVFRANADGTWSEHQRLVPADRQAGDRFGSHIRAEGNLVVIGADQDARDGAGSAYVYRYDGAQWVYEDKLIAADAAAGDRFGFTVDIESERVVIGASEDDGDSGAAYVFRRNAGSQTWSQEAKLVASDRAPGDLPLSMALSDDTVLMGASLHDSCGENAGAVYVFRRSGGTWTQTAKLTASDAAAGDRFGASLAMDGPLAVIGAPGDDGGRGKAYVFQRSGASLREVAQIIGDGQEVGDGFGGSTGMSGDYAVVGANGEDEGRGAGYVFDLSRYPIDAEGPASVGGLAVEAPRPNPAAGPATLRYFLPRPGRVSVDVYDALGRRVRTLAADVPVGEGWHELSTGASALPAGTYLIEVITEAGRQTVPWVVAR